MCLFRVKNPEHPPNIDDLWTKTLSELRDEHGIILFSERNEEIVKIFFESAIHHQHKYNLLTEKVRWLKQEYCVANFVSKVIPCFFKKILSQQRDEIRRAQGALNCQRDLCSFRWTQYLEKRELARTQQLQ